MKNTYLIIQLILFFSSSILFSQRFGDSENCHKNANDPNLLNTQAGRSGAISSAIKLRISQIGNDPISFSSGVMINRNTSDKEIGYYFLTAKHCVDDIDSNAKHEIYFNYQSPNNANGSTHPSNQGNVFTQSTSLEDNGHQYVHTTKLRVVNQFTWGDFALVEMLTPVPPHFNFTYAGWNPNRFYGGLSLGVTNGLPTKYYGVHHPSGDIKKISGSNSVIWGETPIATGCYTVTSVIDFLFGWVWGNKVSTSVVCNYVDNPWLTVPVWNYGISEGGSSGSAIFNNSNKVFGVLSGSTTSCSIPGVTTYGKLHANFSNASIKNTLNPKRNAWVDAFGISERKITRYENLELPGASGVSGHYFPANHYQSENLVRLASTNTIKTTQPITIYEGAAYEFVAGESITLGSNFKVQRGASFSTSIGSSSSKNIEQTPEQQMLEKLKQIDLPSSKKFEIEDHLITNKTLNKVNVYPNPAITHFNINSEENILAYRIFSTNGSLLKEDEVNNILQHKVNIENLSVGTYYLKILLESKKVIVKKIIKED